MGQVLGWLQPTFNYWVNDCWKFCHTQELIKSCRAAAWHGAPVASAQVLGRVGTWNPAGLGALCRGSVESVLNSLVWGLAMTFSPAGRYLETELYNGFTIGAGLVLLCYLVPAAQVWLLSQAWAWQLQFYFCFHPTRRCWQPSECFVVREGGAESRVGGRVWFNQHLWERCQLCRVCRRPWYPQTRPEELSCALNKMEHLL